MKEKRDKRFPKPEGFDFYKRLETFPPEIQERISALSSSLLEKDIHDKLKKDKEAIRGLAKEFTDQGIALNDIAGILTHFGLPLPEEDNGRPTETRRPL